MGTHSSATSDRGWFVVPTSLGPPVPWHSRISGAVSRYIAPVLTTAVPGGL